MVYSWRAVRFCLAAMLAALAFPTASPARPAFDPYDGFILVSYDSENGSVSVLEPGPHAPNR